MPGFLSSASVTSLSLCLLIPCSGGWAPTVSIRDPASLYQVDLLDERSLALPLLDVALQLFLKPRNPGTSRAGIRIPSLMISCMVMLQRSLATLHLS